MHCNLGRIFVATIATKILTDRSCRDYHSDRKFLISATLVAAVIAIATIIESVYPYIVTIAETHFSTKAAMVATGAIIWKPGLNKQDSND